MRVRSKAPLPLGRDPVLGYTQFMRGVETRVGPQVIGPGRLGERRPHSRGRRHPSGSSGIGRRRRLGGCYGIALDLETALCRSLEVLRPEGRIAILDFDRSRPDRGPLRWLYPLYSFILRRAGIDTAEDLDDTLLWRKWARGKSILEAGLRDPPEERYMKDMGFLLAGRKRSNPGVVSE